MEAVNVLLNLYGVETDLELFFACVRLVFCFCFFVTVTFQIKGAGQNASDILSRYFLIAFLRKIKMELFCQQTSIRLNANTHSGGQFDWFSLNNLLRVL